MGFESTDPYCTPKVLESIDKFGYASSSKPSDLGICYLYVSMYIMFKVNNKVYILIMCIIKVCILDVIKYIHYKMLTDHKIKTP